MRILISILTTGVRNECLAQCLQSIIDQKVADNIELAILIVENNSSALAIIQAILSRYKQLTSIHIFHCLETQSGIPFARNKALTFAIDNLFTHLAFIDDDAFAHHHWINELASNMKGYDVVAGPQCALFPENTSLLYTNAKIYRERNIKDNTDIKWAATNNILISLSFLTRFNLKFNEQLINGGEDKELFLRVFMHGGKLHWRVNAIVKEHIVYSRLNIKWALRRAFRMGATGYLIESCNKSKNKVRVTCLFKGSVYFIKGMLSVIPYSLSSKHSVLDSLCDISHGIGFVYGIFTAGTVRKYT